MGYLFLLAAGHYHVLSVGYSTIQDILDGGNTGVLLLLALFVGKLIATVLSLASGASGGIFSPSLFMGATLGGAMGAIGMTLFPNADISVPTFAMIGMGAMVGGATSAAMTAIVMIFEMTRDYNIIVPLVVAVALSIGIRRALVTSDIYTIKLRKRGRLIPTDRSTNMFLIQPVTEIMNRNFKVLPATMKVGEAIDEIEVHATKVVVADDQRIAGFVRFGTLRHDAGRLANETLGSLSSNAFIIATERSTLNDVITRMNRRDRSYAIVIKGNRGVPRPDEVVGIIDREEVAQAVIKNHYG
jgi:CIC family chloride channel protein